MHYKVNKGTELYNKINAAFEKRNEILRKSEALVYDLGAEYGLYSSLNFAGGLCSFFFASKDSFDNAKSKTNWRTPTKSGYGVISYPRDIGKGKGTIKKIKELESISYRNLFIELFDVRFLWPPTHLSINDKSALIEIRPDMFPLIQSKKKNGELEDLINVSAEEFIRLQNETP